MVTWFGLFVPNFCATSLPFTYNTAEVIVTVHRTGATDPAKLVATKEACHVVAAPILFNPCLANWAL